MHWLASELDSDRSWIAAVDRATFVDEPVAREKLVARIATELYEGRGIFLLRGLPVQGRSRENIAEACISFASNFGRLVPQTLAGDLFRWVEDVGAQGVEGGGHRGRLAMQPHTDSADIAVLVCVRGAKKGGNTLVANAVAIFHALLKSSPHHLSLLERGFFFDLTGKDESGVTTERLPVFWLENSGPACRFNKSRIIAGMAARGEVLSAGEVEAVNHMSALAQDPNFALRLRLEPGDALFLFNKRVLHGRQTYEDWPDPCRKRLLLRLWLNT